MLHFFQTVLSPNHNYVTIQDTNYWVSGLDVAEWHLLDKWCRANLPNTVRFKSISLGISLYLADGDEYYCTRDALETRMKELEEIERVFFRELELLRQPKIFWTPSSTELISMLSEQKFYLLGQVGFEPNNSYGELEATFAKDNYIICPHEDNSYHVLFKSSDGVLEYDLMWEEDLDLKLEEESFPLADFMAYCTCHGSASEFHTLWYKTMTFKEKLCTLIKYCGFAEILA